MKAHKRLRSTDSAFLSPTKISERFIFNATLRVGDPIDGSPEVKISILLEVLSH